MTRPFAIALLFVALLSTPAAAGDPRQDARTLFKEGVRQFKAGKLDDALTLFERAYARDPDATILLNIGTTQRKLGRRADAANTYQRYVDDPAAEATTAAEIDTLLAALDATLGTLVISVQPAAAELQLGDDAWRAVSGAVVIRVEPGAFVVRARRAGRESAAVIEQGDVMAGDRRVLDLVVPDARNAPRTWHAADDRETPPGRTRRDLDAEAVAARARPGAFARHRRLIAASLGAAGAIAAGVGVGFALRAHDRFDEARAICGGDRCVEPALGDSLVMSDAARADRLTAGALIGAGAAALVTGAVRWFTAPRTRREFTVAVSPSASDVSLVLAGSF